MNGSKRRSTGWGEDLSQGHHIIGKIDTASSGSNALHNQLAAKAGRPLKPDGWTFSLTLMPWREADGEAKGSKLTVEVACSDREESQRLLEAFAPGVTIAVKTGTRPSPDPEPQKLDLLSIEGEVDDATLAAFKPDIPLSYTHADLGEFRQDTRLPDQHHGSANWAGRTIDLILSDEVGSLDDAAGHAVALLAKAPLWDAEMRDRLYERYYSVWNESWREDGTEFSKSEWMTHFTLESLEVHADGHFAAWVADGDLFWGHNMEVIGAIGSGVENVTMMG